MSIDRRRSTLPRTSAARAPMFRPSRLDPDARDYEEPWLMSDETNPSQWPTENLAGRDDELLGNIDLDETIMNSPYDPDEDDILMEIEEAEAQEQADTDAFDRFLTEGR